MALFQICGKVPEDKDRLINLAINGKKASGCFMSSMFGMVSNRQVVGFVLVHSHLTSVRVTSFERCHLHKIIWESVGYTEMVFRIKGFMYGLNYFMEKGCKAFHK